MNCLWWAVFERDTKPDFSTKAIDLGEYELTYSPSWLAVHSKTEARILNYISV